MPGRCRSWTAERSRSTSCFDCWFCNRCVCFRCKGEQTAPRFSHFLVICRRELVIGAQKGPTSARKRSPPGFRGTLVDAGSYTLALVFLCASWFRWRCRLKRRRALQGRNLPRDNLADGVPPGTRLHGSNHARGVFLCAWWSPEFMPPRILGGLGAKPPGQYPARWFNSSLVRLCDSSSSSSTRGSGRIRIVNAIAHGSRSSSVLLLGEMTREQRRCCPVK